MEIRVPIEGNEKLRRIIDIVNSNETLRTLWRCSNVTAIDRLLINDHGPVHVKIVANIALRILRILKKRGITPNICKDYDLDYEDAEVVVFLAAVLHDIGHAVHRDEHESISVVLSSQILPNILLKVYDEEKATIIMSEVLHAIYAHRAEVKPLTIEAGIIKVSDALDMEEGRARIPFEAGSTSIHAISAISIEEVRIDEGEEKPVRIDITMENPAGMFQVDFLLKNKLANNPVRDFFEIYVHSKSGALREVKVL